MANSSQNDRPIALENGSNQNVITDEDHSIDRSQWMFQILKENPQILSLREKVLPLTGGYSFANLIHAAKTTSTDHINHFIILQLIYNHLFSIGMYKTAEIMKNETGIDFQLLDQPWQKTHLTTLISLGVLPKENIWTIPEYPLTDYFEEPFDEDNFSSKYREDPKLIYNELLNPSIDAVYNGSHDYEHLLSCSLRRLVVFLVFYQPQQLDKIPANAFMSFADVNSFFMILHSITSYEHFLEHLIVLFNFAFPPDLDNRQLELFQKDVNAQLEIKIFIVKLIKNWIMIMKSFIGDKTLKLIKEFVKANIENNDSSQNSERKEHFVNCLVELNKLTQNFNDNQTITYELPLIKDPQLMFKQHLTFLEPEPLEVARQITLHCQKLLKDVSPREFTSLLLLNKFDELKCPLLCEFVAFANKFSHLVIESIVFSTEKIATFSRIIEICSGLENLSNFHVLSVVTNKLLRGKILYLCHASQSQISILKDFRKKCGDVLNSFQNYWKNIEKRFNESKPTISNFNVDIREFKFSHLPDFNDKLINLEKKRKIGKIVLIYHHFRNLIYPFMPVSQIQKTFLIQPQLSEAALKEEIIKFSLV